MIDSLALFHRLPYPLKVAAASARGYYLRWWRYGPDTDRLVREALQRDSWDRDRWSNYQAQRLATMLEHAATRVPYYRDYWNSRSVPGKGRPWSRLENWPILTKEELRKDPSRFVATNYSTNRMFHLNSSGTTGTPLSLWQPRPAVQQWAALFEARWRRWYGVSRHDRWAILGGQLVAPFVQRKPPFWVWNTALRQLYLSSYHLAPEFIPAYVRALAEHEVTYLWGYASSLHSLAQGVLNQGLRPPPIKVAISNAEPLYEHQRGDIARAFDCPVRDTYSMTEFVVAASECEHGVLHQWPEVGVLEIVEDHREVNVSAGRVGRLICTGLLNYGMPLIRYEVGDRGSVPEKSTSCRCGRTLPPLHSIEGRLDDVILTPEGRRIGRLDPVFKGGLELREAQIIQEAPGRIRVRFVPTERFTSSDGEILTSRLRDRVGDMEIALEPVSEIQRSPNGKLRTVISHL